MDFNKDCRVSEKLIFVLAVIGILAAGGYASAAGGRDRPGSDKIKIFDGKLRVIVVNGYSTSFQWPRILQRKLDRQFDGKRVLTVKSATKGGTPIAGWLNVKTGEPSRPWRNVLRPMLKESEDTPVILLAQQSLQGVYGNRREGIRDANDRERIRQGGDALEKYVRLLKKDGADLVFVAMHIYKHPMEPEIGNERLALAELMKRKIPNVVAGPDVWEPTKKLYPQAFARDKMHPNALGAELMAQKWFETLLKYNGLEIPGWSKEKKTPSVQPRVEEGSISDIRALRDLEYVPGGHERNKLDLYLPRQAGREGQASDRLPLIVWVHGGAWMGGNKRNCPARRFVRRGYAVASINYRLSQHAIFPAQIGDCKAAIRWLRANSKRYGLDSKRIGVWGSSAGGHLVALLGTAGDVKEFDKGRNLKFSSRVQAVCDYFGPTDFTKISQFPSKIRHEAPNSPESKLIGGPVLENKEACRRVNPITYVTKDDPPFLIVHGDKDMTVPHNQSQLLYEALKKVGVKVKFHTVKGGGHGGFKSPQVNKMVDDFFDRHLKGRSIEP
ncbi:MAG: alpha/beta hydrolase fold domain-containing protein [Planctomycetota bacterium]|jgi:acetyl esterase/lipase